MRGPHRRGRARVGPGRVLRRASPGSIRGGCRSAVNVDARARDRGAVGRARRRRVRRRGAPRTWRKYRYTIVNRPVPDPFRDRYHVVGARAARPARAAARPPTRSSASTTSRRSAARVPKARRRCARVHESRWVDEGDGVLRYEIRGRVLLADGARDRRHARGGRRGQTPAGRHAGDHARRAIAPRPVSLRRPAACASGTSATELDQLVGTSGRVIGVAGGVRSVSVGSPK